MKSAKSVKSVKAVVPEHHKWIHEHLADFRAATGGHAKKWIAGAIEHKGGLHRSLGVPVGKKIPAAKLAEATHSQNPKVRRQANLAKVLSGFNK